MNDENNGWNKQANGKYNHSTVVDNGFNEWHRKSNYHHYHVYVKVFELEEINQDENLDRFAKIAIIAPD